MSVRFTCYTVALASIFFFGTYDKAFAYLDPGTGSILLQGLIGGIAGGLVVIRLYWGKIKTFFGKKGSSPLSEESGRHSDST